MGWSVHHPIGLLYHAPQHTMRGYTLVANAGGDHATLIDMEGRVCHRWYSERGIPHGYLLPNGNLLCRMKPPPDVEGVAGFGGSSAGLFELDWDGNEVWVYEDASVHHDFLRLDNGNTLTLTWEPIPEELAAMVQGGYVRDEEDAGKPMYSDKVREIAPDGSTVSEWVVWDALDPEEDVICPLERRQEWTHTNSVDLTPGGDFLISMRQIDTVAILGRESGDIKWKWGAGEMSHQHNATFLNNGHVLVFDNGPHRRGPSGSRAVEINPVTSEVEWEYKGMQPLHLFSFHISGVTRLPNGNTLICEGAAGRIIEVTPSKELVWEYINPFFVPDRRFGGVNNMLYRAPRYGPDDPALRGRDLDPGRHGNINRLYAMM